MKVTEIKKKIYASNPNAVKEINGLIKTGYYNDEFILLSDVLKPESSSLYLSPKTSTVEYKGTFRQSFLNKIGAIDLLARNTEDFLNEYLSNNITIYFPYSGMFIDPDPKSFTIVPADREGDEAPGYILQNDNSWLQVNASDEYSVKYPRHLIGVTTDDVTPAPDDIERLEDQNEILNAARCGFYIFWNSPRQFT